MVERFNGRISEVLAMHRFESGENLANTLARYVLLYNQHLPQRALQHRTPIQAMKDWQKQHPDLFKKRVSNRPGLGSQKRQEDHFSQGQLAECAQEKVFFASKKASNGCHRADLGAGNAEEEGQSTSSNGRPT
jgi:hypothetical protein